LGSGGILLCKALVTYSIQSFPVELQLRTHLGHVQKHQHQQTAINLNNPDSQAMHLETRLAQLDSAIQMELWQVGLVSVVFYHICLYFSNYWCEKDVYSLEERI